MTPKVVFFGNSESVFSDRHFHALRQTPCHMLAVVDAPPGKRSSTNIRTPADPPGFVEVARQAGIPAFEPASPSLPLMGRLIEDAERGRLRPKPQPPPGASYYSSVRDEDFRLDWSRDAETLQRWIQTTPGQCFCETRGRRLFFTEAETLENAGVSESPPGLLVRADRRGCIVATGNGALRLRRARPDRGNDQVMSQVCQELGLNEGDILA